ncbi:hypothetical protein NLJ89_g7570 [Agrocybe chaxingu]|uniref:Uncharacterized protein n=1 Tax=Agrocybe chaxingu TaxID=84603 RepID=A0A9W8K3C8_9AGAR|nr:hypothetical protein NLJ89_g7570 [Agrocybe chaxingu]
MRTGDGRGDEERESDGQSEDGESEETAVIQAPLSSKQKRKRVLEKSAPERPTKKVTFERPSKRSKPAQQKPLEPIQSSISSKSNKSTASSSAPTKAVHRAKSPSKAPSSAATAKKALSDPKTKIANVKPKRKASAATAVSKGAVEPEDYDFGKFF